MGKGNFRIRPWVRALHRDIGYLAIGLTFVYALSGLAVNHIGDWDPNFTQIEREHQLPAPWPKDDAALADYTLRMVGHDGPPVDVYRASDSQLEISVASSTGGEDLKLHVDPGTGKVLEQGQSARPILRAVNWLHLNRGKQAWTYVADAYAVFLLYLATSGLFMLPGRKGILGRGAVIATVGAAIPIAYVVLSGP
ncbi:MAG: hypothetical protein RJA70_3661 [Pseudomonadota bacterium]|jgi:hypothetical protein